MPFCLPLVQLKNLHTIKFVNHSLSVIFVATMTNVDGVLPLKHAFQVTIMELLVNKTVFLIGFSVIKLNAQEKSRVVHSEELPLMLKSTKYLNMLIQKFKLFKQSLMLLNLLNN